MKLKLFTIVDLTATSVDTYKELTLCKRIFTTYALFNSNEYAQIRLIEL